MLCVAVCLCDSLDPGALSCFLASLPSPARTSCAVRNLDHPRSILLGVLVRGALSTFQVAELVPRVVLLVSMG